MRRPPRPSCPDFDLAPLKRYRRDVLQVRQTEDEQTAQAKRFTLALALAFNDIKDLAWSQEQLDKGKPEDSTAIDGYRGQWVGMSATYLRLACGLLAELGQLVHVNRSIIQSAIFQTALERVREGDHRGAWDEMVDAYERAPDASGNESFKEPVAKYLNKVRNKAAFHYGHRDDCEELMKGYAARFGGPVTSDGNDHTYVSLGVNAEGTRFYFADAAVIAWMEVARGSLTAQDIRSFFRRVNKALRFIVEGLLDQFEELASKAPGG